MTARTPGTLSRKDDLAGLAAEMMQQDGYSALGLRELAKAAGLKASSLYSHFVSKDEVALLALAAYDDRQARALEGLMSAPSGAARLQGYVAMVAETLLGQDRSCLALMLAVERKAVAPEVLDRVRGFADRNVAWLASAWAQGQTDGSLPAALAAETAGAVLFNGVEGAIAFSLIRPDGVDWFRRQAGQLLKALGATD